MMPIKPGYCTRPKIPGCDRCSFTNHGLDCHENPVSEEHYMTRKEVEVFLDVPTPTVYELAKAGQIVQLQGGVYDAKSVADYKEALNLLTE